VAGRIRSIEKSNDLIGNRTRDIPARSIIPQPTTLPSAPGIAVVQGWKIFSRIGASSRCTKGLLCREVNERGTATHVYLYLHFITCVCF
jgi:hypothetical protein